MPDIHNVTLSAGTSPTVKYTITYSKSRPSNSQMKYDFTISAALGASTSNIGSGLALLCTMTVNGASSQVRIKANDSDDWKGTTPRVRYVSVTCSSTTADTEQGVTFDVKSDGRAAIKSGVINNTAYSVKSAALLPTAPSAPTSVSITPSIFESTGDGMTMSWSGASGGISNAIQRYQVYNYYSNDTVNWTEANWNAGNVTSLKSQGTSISRGQYFRIRIVAIGVTLNSGFSPYSNTVRHNTLPAAPTWVSAGPANYSTENITVSWGGAAGGTSNIKQFIVEYSTSTNASTWGAWYALTTTNTSASSGSVVTSPSRTVGTYTRYRVKTRDTLGAESGYVTSNNVLCSVTACGAPTALSVNATLSENNVTLSWSGATSGAGNAISSYEIDYSESSDNSSWGAWAALTTVNTTAASGSVVVSPPSTRGYYRRFRIRTRGDAGASYYSGWKVSSNSVRKNTQPSAPTTFTASPEIFQGGDVRLAWSGTVAGTSAIKNYIIQISTSTDNSTWGAYSALTTVTTNETSGSYSYSPGTMAAYTRYRICVTDALDVLSGYRASGVIRKNSPPLPPLLSAPKNGSMTFNKRPRILIQTQTEPDGELQTVYVQTASGQTHNSVANPDKFSKSGALESGVYFIYTHDEINPGKVSITVYSSDGTAASGNVSRSFTVVASPFSEISANESTVRAAHMLTLRSAVNTVRDYYGLAAYAWVSEIIGGKTQIQNWSQHIIELRAAIEAVADTIKKYNPKGASEIPRLNWLPLGKGRPRADVMNQLQDIIMQL